MYCRQSLLLTIKFAIKPLPRFACTEHKVFSSHFHVVILSSTVFFETQAKLITTNITYTFRMLIVTMGQLLGYILG